MLSLAARQCSRRTSRGRRRGFRGLFCREIGAYWPWVFSTWSQAAEIFVRFSFRQARTTKSPWSMTLNVAAAGRLLLLGALALRRCRLLGESRRSGRDESEGQNKLAHVILHFDGRRSASFRTVLGGR